MTDIFKGMYSLIKNKKPLAEQKAAIHRDPTPILSADSLLATEKRQQALTDIRSLLSLPEEEFQKVFLTVAENFAEFVQNLPETERSYYANIGGMLDHGLERGSLSLFLCRTYLLPEDATLASVSEREMLWVYAVFTAALLYDVGKIATKHIITLTDEKGQTLKSWLPYDGPMTRENASHYVYGFSEEHHDHMRWMVTPLLARQILPLEGFQWLASDTEIFESWLGLLSDEHRQVGSILTVIPLADAQLLESYFTDRKVFRNNLSPQTIALLSKFQKERKELLKAQKDLRDKMLAEQADKSNDAKEAKDKDTKESEQNKKITKQSLFGFPSISQSDREKTPPVVHDAKEITGRFMDWMKKNSESLSKKEGLLRATTDGHVLIDYKVAQQFIAENKIAQLSTAELQTMLVDKLQKEYAANVNYEYTPIAGSQPVHVQNAMVVKAPNIVGIHSLSALQGNPVQPEKIVETKPTTPTAAEQYDKDQQKEHKEQFKQAISTPRLVR